MIATAPRISIVHDGHAFVASIDYYRLDGETFGGAGASSRHSSQGAFLRLVSLLCKIHGERVDLVVDARVPSPY